ncbi:MAG: 4Fe-4S ferredoxin-type protein [Dehalococcoidales bacterium]|nr:4Fe-4S ferredoxin-type protein [Dehalococcoidales bacterium]
MDSEAKGAKNLFNEVIDAGLCSLCGACAGGCPYLVTYRGNMVALDNCTLSKGQCYQYCPHTYTDMDAISQQIFGSPYSEEPVGTHRQVLIARSKETHIREKAQYGGTVTTLLSLALAEGLIDAALLARMSAEKSPQGFLARTAEEVEQCAGSSYEGSPILETYNRIPRDERYNLGIVALPCQVLALTKMKTEPPQNRLDIRGVQLVIGLFCTWALSAGGFHEFLKENVALHQVRKFDIPPPPANRLDVYTTSGKISFPLEQVRKFTMPGCACCLDMTSEFADLSVGSAEGIEGWNTVIVRTEAGARLIEMAKSKGKLETDNLPAQNLTHLRDAARLKKKRALQEIVSRTGDTTKLLYLGLSPDLTEHLLT